MKLFDLKEPQMSLIEEEKESTSLQPEDVSIQSYDEFVIDEDHVIE